MFAALLVGIAAYHLIPRSIPPRTTRPLILSHRGVHQTFSFEGLKNDTCTAQRIDPPRHAFLENTTPSIAAAFAAGADIVEFDVHPTADERMIVFHDWTLDCRTNGKGVTHKQTLAYLKSLDLGHGYTHDGGRTYPLRGRGVGMMPTIEEVLNAFPDRQLLIDQKDHYRHTIRILAATLNKLPPARREQLFYWNDQRDFDALRSQTTGIRKLLPSSPEMKACAKAYVLRAGLGPLPRQCAQGIMLPARYLNRVPGWPGLVLQKARAAGVPVYVVDVDSIEEARAVRDLPLDGIMTNRIEIVGPVLRARNSR